MKKILIIKLGAKGDVLRTLSLIPAIKKKYPNSEIHWITKPNISDLISSESQIHKVFTIPCELNEEFDIVINFDIEKEATDLVSKINASKKYGFYSEDGFPMAFNSGSEYYLNTMFDDELKKENKKTYQQMMSDAAEIEYNGENLILKMDATQKSFAKNFQSINNLKGKKIIGINMGAGPRWPSKAWAESKIQDCIMKLKEKGYEVILFGGPNETERYKKFIEKLNNNGIKIHQNNSHNSNKEFVALINLCDHIVCSDTFSLHISLALNKPTTCLFFCTSPNEIEDYGLLKKIISPRLYDFFPHKSNEYNEELINSISVEEVLDSIS